MLDGESRYLASCLLSGLHQFLLHFSSGRAFAVVVQLHRQAYLCKFLSNTFSVATQVLASSTDSMFVLQLNTTRQTKQEWQLT